MSGKEIRLFLSMACTLAQRRYCRYVVSISTRSIFWDVLGQRQPAAKAIIRRLDCILLIGLSSPQTVVPVAMHQSGVHHRNVKPGIVEETGGRNIEVSRSLHHYTGLTVHLPQSLDSSHNSASVCLTSKGGITISPKGCMMAIIRLPLETSMPTQSMFIPPIQNLQPEPIFFSLSIQAIG